MDQVKDFLRQCVKYRFWIAFGVSMLLPMIGYLVGAGAIGKATSDREGEINTAKKGIAPYTSPNPPNSQYKPIVDAKKEVLTKDVDETHRRLFAIQEPLLKWPENVEAKFRGWGRKWPENVDRGEVQKTLIDYTIAYPEFVSRVYATCNPWNPEDGTGIVLAPDQAALLSPAPFQAESAPELGAVWAEQERLWVATALLDVVAKVNQSVGAKDWDGAAIKQILAMEVGSATAEDQKSMAKGVVLDPAPVLSPPDAAPAPAAPPAGSPPGLGAPGPSANTNEVYSLHADGSQPYKVVPIRLTVLVDQARLPDYLVALENSPMTIQVMEPDISKPTVPVVRPVYGEIDSNSGMGPSSSPSGRGARGGGGGMAGYPGGGGMGGSSRNSRGSAGGGMSGYGEEMLAGGGRMGAGSAAAPKKGIDLRQKDRVAERKAAKEAASKKSAPKKSADQYYNILEVTIYGQARFYNTPPPAPPVEPSTSAAPAPEPAATPAPDAPKDQAPKAPDAPAKPDAPKPDQPADAPKPDAPKAEPPKPDAPKADAAAPK